MISLIRANCGILQQGKELLERHSDTSYAQSNESTYGSSIGAHLRHVLDHYSAFVNAFDSGIIDYDKRERLTEIEVSRTAAIAEIVQIIKELENFKIDSELSVSVRVSASIEDVEETTQSSLGRELQFLVSHTVHHYALIAIVSRALGISPDRSFGVAPSTLKYLQLSG